MPGGGAALTAAWAEPGIVRFVVRPGGAEMLRLEALHLRQGRFQPMEADCGPAQMAGFERGDRTRPGAANRTLIAGASPGFVPPASGRVPVGGARPDRGWRRAPEGVSMACFLGTTNLFRASERGGANVGLGLFLRGRLSRRAARARPKRPGPVGLEGNGGAAPRRIVHGRQAKAAPPRGNGYLDRGSGPWCCWTDPNCRSGAGDCGSEMAGLVREDGWWAAGRVVLMVTHEPRDAIAVADMAVFRSRMAAPRRRMENRGRCLAIRPEVAAGRYLGGVVG